MVESSASGAPEERDADPLYEEAAGWVARLSSPDASEEDRRAFESWRSADPAHAKAYAEMDALWRRLGHVPDPRPRGTVKAKRGLAGLAVSALLAVSLAYQLGLGDWMRSDLWSGIGEIRQATLPDGSRIDLNTGTAVAVHFTATERAIEVLRGEAFFDVVPDPARPFVVTGGGLSARVVGTRFSVRADESSEPVEVVEGRVEVVGPGKPVQVSAGEAARRQGASLSVVQTDVGRRTAWREGRLVFSGDRLSVVLAELARYRYGRIVLLNEVAGERRVTGVFDPRDTDEALTVIAQTMGVRVTRVTPLLTLVASPL